jgi:hypothetical protein
MRILREVWSNAFEEAIEAGCDESIAGQLADDAAADVLAAEQDAAYDRWRDRDIDVLAAELWVS